MSADKRLIGFASESIYHAARAALTAGLTREEWDTLVGFLWGQAAADHGHAIAAEALRVAADPEGDDV